jgi:hypothetical protein
MLILFLGNCSMRCSTSCIHAALAIIDGGTHFFRLELTILIFSYNKIEYGQQSTPCRHSIQISKWQHTHGKQSFDSREPTVITSQYRDIQFTLCARIRRTKLKFLAVELSSDVIQKLFNALFIIEKIVLKGYSSQLRLTRIQDSLT